jgi:subfamily B ATP-binding cassette protein MsbA
MLILFNNINYKAFVDLDAGRIQNTLTSEIERITQGYNFYLVTFQQGIMALVYLIFSYFIDFKFAILITLGAIITNIFYVNLFKKTKKASLHFTADSNTFHGLISQYINHFKYLNATGLVKKYANKIFGSVRNIETSRKNIGIYNTILGSVKEPVLISMIVSIVLIQINFFDGNIGEILISLLFFYRALTSVASVQYFWNQYISTAGSIDNIVKLQKDFEEAQVSKNLQYNEQTPIILELKNVDFYYGVTPVLKQINLKILPNQTIAFVGESGSGKTTLLNVLSGLLQVDKGQFLVNGEDSKTIDVSQYNKHLGYISQEPAIFNDTLFNNVTFWDTENEQNLIKFRNAIQQAALLDFVNQLSDKEKTLLGNNGINLSGGQKQRIAIARELYKEIEILIMDEATSSLDSETEHSIQNHIDALKGKYTILIAAHRLSTVKNADQIVFMKNGEIIHIGSFEETIENVRDFKRMVELQEL